MKRRRDEAVAGPNVGDDGADSVAIYDVLGSVPAPPRCCIPQLPPDTMVITDGRSMRPAVLFLKGSDEVQFGVGEKEDQ